MISRILPTSGWSLCHERGVGLARWDACRGPPRSGAPSCPSVASGREREPRRVVRGLGCAGGWCRSRTLRRRRGAGGAARRADSGAVGQGEDLVAQGVQGDHPEVQPTRPACGPCRRGARRTSGGGPEVSGRPPVVSPDGQRVALISWGFLTQTRTGGPVAGLRPDDDTTIDVGSLPVVLDQTWNTGNGSALQVVQPDGRHIAIRLCTPAYRPRAGFAYRAALAGRVIHQQHPYGVATTDRTLLAACLDADRFDVEPEDLAVLPAPRGVRHRPPQPRPESDRPAGDRPDVTYQGPQPACGTPGLRRRRCQRPSAARRGRPALSAREDSHREVHDR
jgi:hypothetical protein